jgi:hypothetical protein
MLRDNKEKGFHNYYRTNIRPIFEVMLAAFEQMTLEEIYEIVRSSKYEKNSEDYLYFTFEKFKEYFGMIKGFIRPGKWIRNGGETVAFYHAEIVRWLMNKDDAGEFAVEKEMGSRRICVAWARWEEVKVIYIERKKEEIEFAKITDKLKQEKDLAGRKTDVQKDDTAIERLQSLVQLQKLQIECHQKLNQKLMQISFSSQVN